MKKTFSLIIVSLNTKIGFIKTLESIKSQSLKDFEIIVVDGESNDGTELEIKKSENLITKKIIAKDNGIYDAMNKGLSLINSELTLFMNCGDIFYNKNVLQNIQKFYNNNYDIIFGDTLIDYDSFQVFSKGRQFDNNTILMPFSHQSVFVKSTLLKKNKFDLRYKLASDFDLFLNFYLKKIKFFKYSGIISRVEAYGQSDRYRQKVFSENIRIFAEKKFYSKCLLLIFLKSYELIKIFIKLFIPNRLVNFFLKIKYQKLN